MHLKRLEMVGFKSFADRSELEFVPGVTAIVGPNGSGKSNVTDGIRWVLGSRAPAAARAKMEDVIFSGSESPKAGGVLRGIPHPGQLRSPVEHRLFRVTITRRVYRSGRASTPSTAGHGLKDITELFMDTGIGRKPIR